MRGKVINEIITAGLLENYNLGDKRYILIDGSLK
jgi:hypothetical protein